MQGRGRRTGTAGGNTDSLPWWRPAEQRAFAQRDETRRGGCHWRYFRRCVWCTRRGELRQAFTCQHVRPREPHTGLHPSGCVALHQRHGHPQRMDEAQRGTRRCQLRRHEQDGGHRARGQRGTDHHPVRKRRRANPAERGDRMQHQRAELQYPPQGAPVACRTGRHRLLLCLRNGHHAPDGYGDQDHQGRTCQYVPQPDVPHHAGIRHRCHHRAV